jgi:hypothetical protein
VITRSIRAQSRNSTFESSVICAVKPMRHPIGNDSAFDQHEDYLATGASAPVARFQHAALRRYSVVEGAQGWTIGGDTVGKQGAEMKPTGLCFNSLDGREADFPALAVAGNLARVVIAANGRS